MIKKAPALKQQEQGLDIEAYNVNSSTPQPKLTTSTQSQRKAILKHIQGGRSLTTLYARECMGIMHPAARVMETRKMGYNMLQEGKYGGEE